MADDIRKEVLDMPLTFINWPPHESELLANETNRPGLLMPSLEARLVF